MQYGILRATRQTGETSPQERRVDRELPLPPSSARVVAYGSEAERVAARCPEARSVLFCDATQASAALAEASRRRNAGEAFLVAPILDDAHTILARAAAMNIFQQFEDATQRLHLFAALSEGSMHFNGQPIFANVIHHAQTLNLLAETVRLGNGVYVRSETERMRVETLLRTQSLFTAVAPLADARVPATLPKHDASYIVVWAPSEDASNLAAFSFALSQLNRAAIFVCKGKIPDAPHHFVGMERAHEALTHAAVVIDVEISDPGTAIALAGRGFGLVSSVTSGAHEYVQGVATYTLRDFTSVSDAITRASQCRKTIALPLVDAGWAVRSTLQNAL